jgi:hypothetical protein
MKSFKKFLIEVIQSQHMSSDKLQTSLSQPQSQNGPPSWWIPSTPEEFYDVESWPGMGPNFNDNGQPPSYEEFLRDHPKPEPFMFDENGDGVLSDDEWLEYDRELLFWETYYESWEQEWEIWQEEQVPVQQPKPEQPQKPQKPRKPPEPTPPLTYEQWKAQNPMPQEKDFDRNGDGVLDDAERLAYSQAWDRWAESYERWLREVQEWRRRPGQENFEIS